METSRFSAASSFPPPGAGPPGGGPPPTGSPAPRPGRTPARWWLIAALAVALAVAAVLALGLRDGSQEGGSLSPIAEAAQRTGEVEGSRFSGTGTGTASGLEIEMSFRGAYNGETDRSRMRFVSKVPGQPEVAETLNPLIGVQDGLTMYMSSPAFSSELPDDKSWMKVDLSEFAAEEPTTFGDSMDPRAMLEQLELVSEDARVVGEEEVRGVRTTHYAATLDPARQAEQLREAGDELGADVIESQGGPSEVDVWIDRKGLVRRVATKVPFELLAGPGATMSMTIDFHDFGVTPTVEIPPEDAVFDATELSREALERAVGES